MEHNFLLALSGSANLTLAPGGGASRGLLFGP
jgi:hypothetical protein